LANKTVAVIGAQLEVLQFSDVLVVVNLNCKLFLFKPFSDIQLNCESSLCLS